MSIFKDNGDKEKFLQRLGENIDKGRSFVYAWVVMDNLHIFLLRAANRASASIKLSRTILIRP